MSAASVRAAITAWLQPPAVTGLNQVLPGAPWLIDGASWDLASDLGWGAIGVVHLEHEAEHRIAMGGAHGGLKQVTHNCGLLVIFQFLIPQNLDPTEGATAYVDPLDQLLDGIRARIRADRTLGTGPAPPLEPGQSAILQAGEGDGTGAPDIAVTRDLPRRDVGKVWAKNLIEFTVIEVAAT